MRNPNAISDLTELTCEGTNVVSEKIALHNKKNSLHLIQKQPQRQNDNHE